MGPKTVFPFSFFGLIIIKFSYRLCVLSQVSLLTSLLLRWNKIRFVESSQGIRKTYSYLFEKKMPKIPSSQIIYSLLNITWCTCMQFIASLWIRASKGWSTYNGQCAMGTYRRMVQDEGVLFISGSSDAELNAYMKYRWIKLLTSLQAESFPFTLPNVKFLNFQWSRMKWLHCWSNNMYWFFASPFMHFSFNSDHKISNMKNRIQNFIQYWWGSFSCSISR